MITPRRTRLVRVPHLRAFRRAIAAIANSRDTPHASVIVVVPTRGAARHLLRLPAATGVPFDAVTRDELYDRLHARLASPPRRLTELERDIIMQAAARQAWQAGVFGFHLRPGLIAEMVRFYDQLRRQMQQVARFEELIEQALGGDTTTDRGAERILAQTRFLATTFRTYEQRVRELASCDEHSLRRQLIAEPSADPIRHVVVTVSDWIADPAGLFLADFDLLTRVPGLERLDIVSTEGMLRSGFHERLHNWWPGLEETREDDVAYSMPTLVIPSANTNWFTSRDREEELITVAKGIWAGRAGRAGGAGEALERIGVVYKRPLPYLYLAGETLGAAGIPHQTSDALPLAAEPVASAIDLALDLVASDYSRTAIVALLRSPHFHCSHDGASVTMEAVSALGRELSELRYLGGLERLEALASEWTGERSRPALEASLAAARQLAPLSDAHPMSEQVERLLAFVAPDSRSASQDQDPLGAREQRARDAIVGALSALAEAHAAYDDRPASIDEVAAAVRRSIESRTFDLDQSEAGVQLLDDQAARYAELDQMTVVGLIEGEWPERPRRNIFYPSRLLAALNWPSEKERRAAADASFVDLLASPVDRVALSTFTLDDEALVEPSMQLEDAERARLPTEILALDDDIRMFESDARSIDPFQLDDVPGAARVWAELRQQRSAPESAMFHGQVAGTPRRVWSVSALETYLACPFKFFAQHVLRLQEEPEDEEVMDPKAEGRFIHEVFESFFRTWQASGHQAITPRNLDSAREVFAAVVDTAVEQLPAPEAALQRTRLLGSSAAAGLGEAVLRMEAERPTPVTERLLEHDLSGEFLFETDGEARKVALRGKADRIDLLNDGTFRLIDYKLGWPPDRRRALQLPVYSICAGQQLADYRGRAWTLDEAVYLAFKGPRRVAPLFSSPSDGAKALRDASQRLVDTIDAIDRGEFPPTPDDVFRCENCAYSSVCRKDYVGDV